jgi:hypothetical protein
LPCISISFLLNIFDLFSCCFSFIQTRENKTKIRFATTLLKTKRPEDDATQSGKKRREEERREEKRRGEERREEGRRGEGRRGEGRRGERTLFIFPIPILFTSALRCRLSYFIYLGNSEASSKHFNRNSKVSLTAMERNQNEEIQKSMTHKLHYKRNPHNNPENVKNLLIKPNQRKEISGNRAIKNNENGNSFGTSSSLKNTKNMNIPLFIAEPASVEFLEFGIGDVLKQTLCLRNISTISRTLRVLPPAGGRFGMSPLIYPSGIFCVLFSPLLFV